MSKGDWTPQQSVIVQVKTLAVQAQQLILFCLLLFYSVCTL